MSCIFCQINQEQIPSHTIYQDDHCRAIVDKFPLSPGHVIVLSKTHQGSVDDLPETELTAMWSAARRISKAMKAADNSVKDVHFLINDGPAANQHVPHVHLHVIPRYGWDLGMLPVRFMTRFVNPLNHWGRSKESAQWAESLSTQL
ncbi:HIT family protein [Litoribrevibacter albus]|uniref:HIT family protein n=1 Tax=Litoribrevibacter albus TaxID=1473156 RepID=A0AA37W7T1_9GAMM|nr:HIT domain-containing protein [Litoribrevibacter albus]GLQ33100.1 HIT family protein [Litoribrevibacter albus]